MLIDFTEERLPRSRYIKRITRHKVLAGWYVRALISGMGHGSRIHCEAALYLYDPEYAWDITDKKWVKISASFNGGVYKLQAPGGWLLFSTFLQTGAMDTPSPRTGALVFVPDSNLEWECKIIEEASGIFG